MSSKWENLSEQVPLSCAGKQGKSKTLGAQVRKERWGAGGCALAEPWPRGPTAGQGLPSLSHLLRGETESHLGCFVGPLTPNLGGAILLRVPCCPGMKGA